MAIVGQFAWASRSTSGVPLGGWLGAERAAHQLCRAIVAIADGDAAAFWSSMPLEIRPRGALAKAIEGERQRRITWKRIEQSAELLRRLWPLRIIFSCQQGINLGLTVGGGLIVGS